MVAAGVLMAGLLAGGAVFAQGPGGPGGRGGPGRGGRFGGAGDLALPLRELNLSDAQRQQVRDIVTRHAEQDRQVQERLRAAMDAQRKAVETLPVNEGAIRAASADLANAEADAAIARAHLRADVFQVLTPEQQDQAKKLQAQVPRRR
jgi:Spy/CpxP family protein refolding chaperone